MMAKRVEKITFGVMVRPASVASWSTAQITIAAHCIRVSADQWPDQVRSSDLER